MWRLYSPHRAGRTCRGTAYIGTPAGPNYMGEENNHSPTEGPNDSEQVCVECGDVLPTDRIEKGVHWICLHMTSVCEDDYYDYDDDEGDVE